MIFVLEHFVQKCPSKEEEKKINLKQNTKSRCQNYDTVIYEPKDGLFERERESNDNANLGRQEICMTRLGSSKLGSVTSTGTRPGREARKRTRAEKKKAMEEA